LAHHLRPKIKGMNNHTSMQGVGVQIDYQPDVDLLFAWIGDPQEAENIEVDEGIYVRIAPATQQVIGIEVLDCAERFQQEPSAEFAKQLIERYARPALQRFLADRPNPSLFSSRQ
jgi:uncharacterized protein YuzE